MKNNFPLDIIKFSEDWLGMPLHQGQVFWLQNCWKFINILKPANQWGKTTVEAIFHIYHALVKPQLDRFDLDNSTWYRTRYQTLNFGKTYEVARGVMESVIDITEGKYLLPDGNFNKSRLAGKAIVGIDDMPKLPAIHWFTNADTLIRSYDGLGEAFKRLKLAAVTGDELGDIPELRLFLNGTLVPRVSFFQGQIHLVGTSQPEGIEYEEITEEAELDLKRKGNKSNYFVLSANLYPEMASVYQNKYMPRERLAQIEETADPELKKQIIYGLYVDYSEHLYTWEEVAQMFEDFPYDSDTGFSFVPEKDHFYAFATDLAAAKDETSVTCIEYNRYELGRDNIKIPLPHRIVFHKAWKGESIPLSLQYQLISEYFMKFKRVSPNRSKFIYDAGSLGGKNAGQAFQALNGYPFPPKGRSYAEIKAEAMGKVKEVLGRGRDFSIGESGLKVEKNKEWGGIKASNKLKELRRQLEVASKDDDKIKNDQFSSFMMALHFIEMRSPKVTNVRAVDFNISRSTIFLTG